MEQLHDGSRSECKDWARVEVLVSRLPSQRGLFDATMHQEAADLDLEAAFRLAKMEMVQWKVIVEKLNQMLEDRKLQRASSSSSSKLCHSQKQQQSKGKGKIIKDTPAPSSRK